MKKYLIYIAVLGLGLALGWLIFGGQTNEDVTLSEQSISKNEAEIWTCSMHPQIRLPEPGDCPICGMDLILLEAGINNTNPMVFEMTEDAIKIANIQTTEIGANTVNSEGLKLSGKIKADETNSASIVSHITGRIEKLFISYTGEKVTKGQKIASIYSPKLITAQKELLEAYKVRNTNPKLYEATANKLKFWKLTDKQIQGIIASKKIIESFNIYAQFSGIVLNKKVSVGDHLNEGEVLFDIQNLNQLWAVFDVYETDLANIKKGDKISFSTPAIPNKIITSHIIFVDPVINPNTRTAEVRTAINNQNQLLKPEMFLVGVVNSKNNGESILVPKSAVLWTGERSVVYIKLPDITIPSFEFREITIGASFGTNYRVLKGLSYGDEVVTNGAFVIDASAQLNNQSSMMNRVLINNQEESVLPDFTTITSPDFKNQLGEVLTNYLEVKNALVNSDEKAVELNSSELINAIKSIDMTLIKGDAHMYWMKQEEDLLNLSEAILNSNGLEEQRTNFAGFSILLINLTKVYGVEKETYYVQFCPMAESKEGGYWLSQNQDVKNPYFGDAMLGCGSVEDTIDKDFKNEKAVKKVINKPMAGHNH